MAVLDTEAGLAALDTKAGMADSVPRPTSQNSGSQWYPDRTQVGKDRAFSTDGHLNEYLSG